MDGYFEGSSLSDSFGSYTHSKQHFFTGFSSTVGGQPQKRTKALKATLYPFGIEHTFPNTLKESFSLFSGERTLCIQLKTATRQKLGFISEITNIAQQGTLHFSPNGTTLALHNEAKSDDPNYLTIICNKPLQPIELTHHSQKTAGI